MRVIVFPDKQANQPKSSKECQMVNKHCPEKEAQEIGSTLVLLELHGCNNLIKNPRTLKKRIRELVEEKMVIRKTGQDQWEHGAISFILFLAESHVYVETWPENNYIKVHVHICNYTRNNRSKAEKLAADIAKLAGATGVEAWSIQGGPISPLKVLSEKPF